MRAYITPMGSLVLLPESATEEFACRALSEILDSPETRDRFVLGYQSSTYNEKGEEIQ